MKNKSLVVFLLFAIVLGMPMIAVDNSPRSQHNTTLFNACQITVTMDSTGEIVAETEFSGSDTANIEVSVEFTPGVIIDSDNQYAQGLFGKITAWVWGYYQQYDTAYYIEKHRVDYESLLGGYLQNVDVTCIGDNVYEDVYHTYGSVVTYYEDISIVCSTRIECEVWAGWWLIGTVNIVAVIYGP